MHASPTHQSYYGWSSTTASVNVSCAHAVRMPKGRNGEENEQAYFSADGLDCERGNLVSRQEGNVHTCTLLCDTLLPVHVHV